MNIALSFALAMGAGVLFGLTLRLYGRDTGWGVLPGLTGFAVVFWSLWFIKPWLKASPDGRLLLGLLALVCFFFAGVTLGLRAFRRFDPSVRADET